MNVPKPLALPHLARHCGKSPQEICKALVDAAKGSPGFSYRNVDSVLQKFLLGHFSSSQLTDALRSCAPKGREGLFAELSQPLFTAFEHVKAGHSLPIGPLRLVIPGGLVVPFDPGFGYVPEGAHHLVVPYRIYWKRIQLNEAQIRLFFSFARELLLEDDNFADAELHLVVMPESPDGGRAVSTYRSSDFDLATASELNDVLETYRLGFQLATVEVAKLPQRQRKRKPQQGPNLDLFQ